MEGVLREGPLDTPQYQFAPKCSILIGLMMQKDIGLHGIVLVVIVVVIHEVIHIPYVINVILIRIPRFVRFLSPFGSVFGQKRSKMGLFDKAKITGLNFVDSSRNFPNNI